MIVFHVKTTSPSCAGHKFGERYAQLSRSGLSRENRGQAPPISVLPGLFKASYANESRGMRETGGSAPL